MVNARLFGGLCVVLTLPLAQGVVIDAAVQRHTSKALAASGMMNAMGSAWQKYSTAVMDSYSAFAANADEETQAKLKLLETNTPQGIELTRKSEFKGYGGQFSAQISNCSTPTTTGTEKCMVPWGDILKIRVAPTFPTKMTKDSWWAVSMKPKLSGLVGMAMMPLMAVLNKIPNLDLRCPVCGGVCTVQTGDFSQEFQMFDCADLPQNEEVPLAEVELPMPNATQILDMSQVFTMTPKAFVESLPPYMRYNLPKSEDFDTLAKLLMVLSHGIGFEAKMSLGLNNATTLWSEKVLTSPASPGGTIVKTTW